MPRPTVFLFDIDGTLLLTGGAGRRAIEGAFARAVGRPDACRGFSFGGMTDRAIVRAGLTAVGEPVTTARIDAILDVYLSLLAHEVQHTPRYQIMPGVENAVALLRARANCAVGLGTGNIRSGAEIKLARGDLWRHFDFGGFGCDDEDRTALLAVGAARGAGRLGVPVSACRVVVIGDTERDVAAARGIGAECIAVGTGSVSLEVLRQAGADHVYADLTAKEALAALFGDD
jgi:phosphoglycolate phosphatase